MSTTAQWFQSGVELHRQGQFAEARSLFEQVLAAEPRHADALLHLGGVLYQQGQFADAVNTLERAVQAAPDSVAARHALACAYHAADRVDEAVAAFRQVLRQAPDYAEAHYNLGTALRQQDHRREAVVCFRDALRLDPTLLEAYVNLAEASTALSQPDEAVAASRAALARAPRWARAHEALADALMFQGDMNGTVEALRQGVQCEPDDAALGSNLVYALNFQAGTDSRALLAAHRDWAARHAEQLTAQAAPHSNDPAVSRRLRVGYVSSHFRDHAVSLFSEPLLAAHDHGELEVFAYADVRQGDAFTERFRASVDVWRSIAGQSDEAVAAQVRADGIDILVDLAGHIGGNRLLVFARKPAPIQVTYLGYQNTTGMSAMDYRLTDAWSDPPGTTDADYTEALVRLPASFFCYRPPQPAPPVNELPALARGYVTFGSMNNVCKISPGCWQAWAQILAAVNGSRLRVLAYPGGVFERNVRDVMERAGISAERVEVVVRRPRYEYLELHHDFDIALDTFPFNGHTTTCDALWMGVPSVMMKGSHYAARFGSSALVNLGLGEWIAETPAEYVRVAVERAADLAGLAQTRAGLRGRMEQSVLLDAARFARSVEAAYRRMWRTWCEQATRT